MGLGKLFVSLLVLAALCASRAMGGPTRAVLSTSLNSAQLQTGQQAVLAVVLDIADGFHAQSNTPLDDGYIKFEVTVDPATGVDSFAPIYPPGTIENYPKLGKLSVYTGRVVAYVPLQVASDVAVGPLAIKGRVTYQLCDDNLCYGPEEIPFGLTTTVVAAGQLVQPANAELFKSFDPAVFSRLVKPSSPVDKVALFGRDLDQAPIVFTFAAAFLIGVIFNIVPCVLPVVPLKAIGFYEVSQHNRGKCLLLGAVFSLGLVASFAVLGLLVVVLRKFAWGEQFSNPWFLGGIVAILAIMAAGMFGAFNVGLPTAVYRFTPRHDTYLGNFLFGILTAVLSTPCTFGMFLGLMIWATRQPAALGMSLVVMVGVGMASPYFLLSAYPELARRFPRTGPWAELVKQLMGFLLLVSAVYFARRFIEQAVGDKAFWWALFTVVAAAGVFLVVRSAQFARSRIGPMIATTLALLMVAPALAVTLRITNPRIDWKPYTEEALALARQSGRPVMLEFTAAWCGNCLALETTVFHDDNVVRAIKEQRAITLRADLTKTDAPGWKLLREISPVGAIPLTAVYLNNQSEPQRLSGIYSSEQLIETLRQVTTSSTQNPS
ncbi:MAG: thioredoxin family protein [Tepidisphaeraceae bacterium]